MTGRSSPNSPRGVLARTTAQAKLNLFLRVLAREAGGYHQIETLFCRLDLGDDVTVRTDVRGRSIDCAGVTVPAAGFGPPERNLAWRAAAAFAERTGWPNEWAIEITKRIPVGAGLGGGSADAGAVLRCLNALAPRPLAPAELVATAAALGADVPFLAVEAPVSVAWGRGERMLTLPPLPHRPVTLACFSFGVSTPDAYGWVDLARGETVSGPIVYRLEQFASWHGVAGVAHNDFEAVVCARHADIARVLAVLRTHAGNDPGAIALLTGSGSTVAYLSSSPADHERVRDGRLGGIADRLIATRTAAAVVGVEVAG